MRSLRPSLLALLALLAGPLALADQPCASIQFRSADSPGRAGSGFSATATTDIVFLVNLLPSFEGNHLLELRVLTPRGYHYQTIAVPLTTRGGPSARAVPGYPRPLETKVPKAGTDGVNRVLTVEVPFPVGGTMIQANSLYGTWKVEPILDAAEQACAKPTSFTIKQ